MGMRQNKTVYHSMEAPSLAKSLMLKLPLSSDFRVKKIHFRPLYQVSF